jgi:ribonuclease R
VLQEPSGAGAGAVTVSPMHNDTSPAQRRHQPRQRRRQVEGTLRFHPRGFGFLTIHSTPGAAVADDLFVQPNHLTGFFDGDVVRAVVLGERIVSFELIKRARTEVYGDVTEPGLAAFDPGVGTGTVAFTGDGIVGHTVVLVPRGEQWVVSEDLGPTFDPAVLARRMLARHMFDEHHSDATVLDAQRIAAAATSASVVPTRRDLRDQGVITIDADHSRDLDDALYARRDRDGCVRVWVHIADVAEYVTPQSACDVAAATVPTSVYLPTQTRPMLPAVLSDNVLSLIPGVERDVLTVEMRVSADGTIASCDVYESRIRSRKRLSYHTVAGILRGADHDASGVELDRGIIDVVQTCWAAAVRIGIVRKQRGGVDGGRLGEESAEEAENRDAHTLVERLMVATNEAVAEWLEARNMPAIYRCHGAPEQDAVAEIEATANAFACNAPLTHPLTPIAFSVFVDQIAQNPNVDAIWDVIGGALQRATYTTANVGHFGLGSRSYLHFTSPLRRYADLVVHRIVKAYLHGNRDGIVDGAEGLDALSAHITDVSGRADRAERDTRIAMALHALEIQQQRRGTGVVKSVQENAIRIHVPALAPCTGTIPVRKLGRGWRVDVVRREAVRGNERVAVGGDVAVRAKRIVPLAGVLELQLTNAARSGNNRQNQQPRRDATTQSAKPSSTANRPGSANQANRNGGARHGATRRGKRARRGNGSTPATQ